MKLVPSICNNMQGQEALQIQINWLWQWFFWMRTQESRRPPEGHDLCVETKLRKGNYRCTPIVISVFSLPSRMKGKASCLPSHMLNGRVVGLKKFKEWRPHGASSGWASSRYRVLVLFLPPFLLVAAPSGILQQKLNNSSTSLLKGRPSPPSLQGHYF